MNKTLLFRTFKIGGIPKAALSRILTEGVLLSDEGIGGSVTYRNYRAPGKYHGWRRNWFSGSLVMTRESLLAFRYSKPIIGLRWVDGQVGQLHFETDGDNSLSIGFDASVFSEESSGRVEVRFSTAKARSFLMTFKRKTAGPG